MHHFRNALLAGCAFALALSSAARAEDAKGPPGPFPPWQHGDNNDATPRGLPFTVPEVDVLADFHGSLDDPKLVLFVGGNYFFAMAPLVKAFEASHPEYKGRIFLETIPPGLLVKQMEAGGTVTVGNMTFTVKPDAYFAGLKKVEALIHEDKLVGPAVPYVTNTLTIMVPKGNPAGVKGLADLGKPGIRLAMPNPEFEGIARQIKMSLAKAGGKDLETAVYDTKVKDGSTRTMTGKYNLVYTKVDKLRASARGLLRQSVRDAFAGRSVLPPLLTSGQTGEGVGEIWAAILDALPAKA